MSWGCGCNPDNFGHLLWQLKARSGCCKTPKTSLQMQWPNKVPWPHVTTSKLWWYKCSFWESCLWDSHTNNAHFENSRVNKIETVGRQWGLCTSFLCRSSLLQAYIATESQALWKCKAVRSCLCPPEKQINAHCSPGMWMELILRDLMEQETMK